jgi:hypothetical protein
LRAGATFARFAPRRAGALAVLAAGSASNSTITAIGGLGAAHRQQVRVLVGFYVAGVVSFTKRYSIARTLYVQCRVDALMSRREHERERHEFSMV